MYMCITWGECARGRVAGGAPPGHAGARDEAHEMEEA